MLHGYQRYCVDFIREHPSCALLLDMGLGKTVTTLTAISRLVFEDLEVTKVLVVAPLRVARDTWPAEIAKWPHLKNLSYSLVLGSREERDAALRRNTVLYIINRENIPYLVERYKSMRRKWDFDMVVIDELSSFKSPQAKRFKALRSVRPLTKRWVGLTGTPAPNGLLDLWAEIYILDGGERLGRFISRYREEYFRPGAYNPQTNIVYRYDILPGAEEKIYRKISDMTVSMTAKDYLKMPDLVSVKRAVRMDGRERAMYEKLKSDMVLTLDGGGGDIDAMTSASLSNKLLQMANGRVYDEDGEARFIHRRKAEALTDLVEEANGQTVLVAYWFRHDLAAIMEAMEAAGYEAREIRESRDVADWNAGKIPVGLIHPASAGHGLNLQAGGHILVWYGMTWSLELYQQTNARLYRQGQTHVVTIHHIVCEDTIDVRVLAALESKHVTQDRLIGAVRAELGAEDAKTGVPGRAGTVYSEGG